MHMLAALIVATTVAIPNDDIRTAREDYKQLEERSFYRYFSTYAVKNRENFESVLNFWLANLTSRAVTRPPVKISDTLYRIDLRDFKWDTEIWGKVSNRTPYQAGTGTNKAGKLIVRADWFLVETSDTETRSDAYYELLYNGDVPANLTEFQDFWGIRIADAEKLELDKAAVVDEGKSIVALQNRIIYRWPSLTGGHHETYDTLDEDYTQNPESKSREGAEVITAKPGGLQAYLLINAAGDRVDAADPQLAVDSTDPIDKRVRTPISCVRCHGSVSGYHIPANYLKELDDLGIAFATDSKKLLFDVERKHLTDSETLYKTDQLQYESAIRQVGGISAEQITKDFAQAVQDYLSPVSLEQAATELKSTTQEIQEVCEESVNGRLRALTKGVAIPRKFWEQNVYVELKALILGKHSERNEKETIEDETIEEEVIESSDIYTDSMLELPGS